MAHHPRPHPAALPHGSLTEVLPGIFVVTGTVAMPGPVSVRFSRNMVVLREPDGLVLVNTVRLGDAGLAALEALGPVRQVIRLAANHGQDDPFYQERYGVPVWVVKGQRYTAGFNTSSPDTYLDPDGEMDESTPLPVAGASLYVIHSNPPEGLLLLERHGGTLISGDCLQNWAAADARFNLAGRLMMRMAGFIQPWNVGPGWLRQGKPPKADLRSILTLPFVNVLPAHGTAVLGDAVERFRPSLERVSAGA